MTREQQLRDDFWRERERVDLLRAEIERLKAAEDHDLRCKKSLRAEIERLQAESAAFRGKLAEQCGQTLVARAEVERLRQVRDAACRIVEECEGGTMPPSLISLARLESALSIDWHARAALEPKS